MNLRIILALVLAFLATACAEKDDAQTTPESAVQGPSPDAAESPTANVGSIDAGFLAHMHLHAEKLDDVNFALADGDLEAARTPANWLSRHDTDDGVQQGWLPYLYAMRTEAEVVQTATDLETARAAAARINAQCQACHAAAGVSTP